MPWPARLKRLIDVTASLLFLLSAPLHLFWVEKPLSFFANCLAVLVGAKTWVGYGAAPQPGLPPLRKSVLAPAGRKASVESLPAEGRRSLYYWYARNYAPVQDVKTISSNHRYLGD